MIPFEDAINAAWQEWCAESADPDGVDLVGNPTFSDLPLSDYVKDALAAVGWTIVGDESGDIPMGTQLQAVQEVVWDPLDDQGRVTTDRWQNRWYGGVGQTSVFVPELGDRLVFRPVIACDVHGVDDCSVCLRADREEAAARRDPLGGVLYDDDGKRRR